MSSAWRRPLSPQTVDQPITGNRFIRVQQENGEQRALLRPSQRKLATVAPRPDGTENRELHDD
jgi:hypothetical protein